LMPRLVCCWYVEVAIMMLSRSGVGMRRTDHSRSEVY
jgi:hypothetical protein